MTLSEQLDDLLHSEADILARYLVGRAAGAELAGRYAEASRLLFGADAERDGLSGFVRRHPRSLPYLDAAAGLRAPASLLRKKALLMTAILEASPDFVDEFLPRTVSPVGFVFGGAWTGAVAVWRAALGLVLWPFVAKGAERGGNA